MNPASLIDEKKMAEVEAKLKETKIKLEKMVRDYPLTSVALALGAGYVIARIIERSRK